MGRSYELRPEYRAPGAKRASGATTYPKEREVALMRRMLLLVTVAAMMAAMMVVAGPASATLHPVVESFDCAYDNTSNKHPTGDVGSPPGQTFPQGPAGQNDHRALKATSDDFTDFSSPAWFGHKLDGKCGKVGQ